MFHPSRGGVRGGKDQFKWDDIKSDEHRENYLGHSLKAPVGRWQKGKDLFWYSRDKKQDPMEYSNVQVELQLVKEEEEKMMQEALGLAPRRDSKSRVQLDEQEAQKLFKRRSVEAAPEYGKGERVQGLGFAPSAAVERPAAPTKREPKENLLGNVDPEARHKASKEKVKVLDSTSFGAESSGSDEEETKEGGKAVGEKVFIDEKRSRKLHKEKREEGKRRKEERKGKVKEGKKSQKRKRREERRDQKKSRREERSVAEGKIARKTEKKQDERERSDRVHNTEVRKIQNNGTRLGREGLKRERHDTDSE